MNYSYIWRSCDLTRLRRNEVIKKLFSVNSENSSAKRIVFLGTPECAALSLKILSDNSQQLYQVIGVVSQPPAPSGRQKKLTKSPVHILSEELSIPILTPESAKDEDFLLTLQSLKPDLCVTAAYGNFLPKKFLEIPAFGTLNIHPSLLPLYRGAAPIQRCLENGDLETGVSVVQTVLKMDAGPIVRQIRRKLNGDEKCDDLLLEMFKVGTDELIDCLPSVFDKSAVFTKQDDEKATSANKLDSKESRIDFSTMNALTIHNKVRAYAGWPGTWSLFRFGNDLQSQRIKIITTSVFKAEPSSVSDQFIKSIEIAKVQKNDVLRVTCGDGSMIDILEVQPDAKKIMKAKDLINGLRGDKLIYWDIPTL